MNKKNLEIRNMLKAKGMRHWQLAELLNISEATLCRKFRRELPPDEQKMIIDLIENWEG